MPAIPSLNADADLLCNLADATPAAGGEREAAASACAIAADASPGQGPLPECSFHALVQQSLTGLYVIQDGNFRYVNDRFLEFFGCSREDMDSFESFIDWAVVPEDRAMVRENIRRRLDGEVDNLRYSIRCRRKDGTPVYIEVHGRRADYQGLPAIVGIVFDVTARRQAELELDREHQFISAVLDTVGALVIVLDRQGHVVRFNRQCELASGYTVDEVAGRTIWDCLLTPEERPTVAAVFEHLLTGTFPNQFENHWVTKTGAIRLIAWTNTVLLDAAGQVEFVIGTGLDVTERRRMEAAMRESEQRYRLLFNSGYDAIMVHALVPGGRPGRIIEVNDLACRRLGYTREEMLRLTPADIDAAGFDAATPKIARQIEVHGHALFERVHQTRDGREIPVEISTHRVELGGQPVALSIARDISERRLAEEALRENEARLKEITSELGDGIYVLDRAGRLTFMNKAAEQMLGWREAELLGRNAHETFHFQKLDGTPVPMCDCPVYHSIHSGETYRVHEDYFTRRDGRLFPVSFVSTPLHRSGEIVGSVAAFQDITALKAAQERIQYMAHYDMLTNLPNRTLLADRLERALAHARRNGQGLALAFMDLDGFKQVNDSLGHDAGDILLKVIAQRLQACLRESDTVARMGGDEFVMLLTDVMQPGEVEVVVRKVLDTVNQPISLNDQLTHVGVSVGVALYPAHGEDPQSLMKHADQAMYLAKEGGRNGYRFYRQESPLGVA